MNNNWGSRLTNLAWYQAIWFSAVLGGETLAWLAFGLLLAHLIWVNDWKGQLMLMLVAAMMGGGIDALIAAGGYYQFEATDNGLPLPLWLIAIWMGFAGTLRHSMSWLVARPKMMVALALFGAPLTYLSAARLGAVDFPMGSLNTALLIGLNWMAVLPTLLALNAYLLKQSRNSQTLTELTINREQT